MDKIEEKRKEEEEEEEDKRKEERSKGKKRTQVRNYENMILYRKVRNNEYLCGNMGVWNLSMVLYGTC